MDRKSARTAVLLGALLIAPNLTAAPALAHHSFAMFDMTKPTVMKGTVKELEWTNPHITLWVFLEAGPGQEPQLWNFEATSPGNLARVGWTKNSFRPGDKIEISYFPLRDGRQGGAFIKATQIATGTVIGGRPPAKK